MEQDKKYEENYKDDHVLFPVAAIDSTSPPPHPRYLPTLSLSRRKYQISLYKEMSPILADQ